MFAFELVLSNGIEDCGDEGIVYGVTNVCFQLFVCVCVEILRPSQPNGVMSSAVSLPNHMFTRQA